MLAIRLVNPQFVKQTKQCLELHGLLDKSVKITTHSDGFTICTLTTDPSQLKLILDEVQIDENEYQIIPLEPNIISDPITLCITQILDGINHQHNHQHNLPHIINIFSKRRYSIYPPLILFTAGTGLKQLDLPATFYQQVLLHQSKLFQTKDMTHIAENAPIPESDRIRRPSDLISLYGDFGPAPSPSTPSESDFQAAFWCSAVQNGIYQTWAPQYTMFSRGNISEKARVLNTFSKQAPIKDTTVVDLYAGIGYFTFSYAKNSPSTILCWEINPWSVEGLIRGARKNNWNIRLIHSNQSYYPLPDDFIIIFLEDNANALNRITRANITNISHINLGLIPTSRLAWNDALQLGLHSSSPTILHIHENISSSITKTWPDTVTKTLNDNVCFLYLELIKTFAPGVYHVCGDFQVNKPL